MNVNLAGKAHPLLPPAGMARLDVLASYPGDEAPLPRRVRWAFGVVGMLWAGKAQGWPDLAACKHDMVAFGELVFSGLSAAGLLGSDPTEAVGVLGAMIELMVGLLPTAEAVQESRDFSQPPSGKTSGEASRQA